MLWLCCLFFVVLLCGCWRVVLSLWCLSCFDGVLCSCCVVVVLYCGVVGILRCFVVLVFCCVVVSCFCGFDVLLLR